MRLPVQGLLLATLGIPGVALAQEVPKEGPDKSVEAVVVTAARAPDVVTAIDRKAYAVGKDVVAASGTLADLLRSVPSVDVDAQGNVSLRGDSAVRITIDGKPAGMLNGDARGQAVQSLPADQYERVEVITNPSADQSAEGASGIINLISKTGRKAGASGSARATVGTLGQYLVGTTYAYNTGKLSLNADASLRDRDPQIFGSTDARRETTATGVETGRLITSRYHGLGHILSLRTGADYDLGSRTRLGVQARYQLVAGSQPGTERFEDYFPSGAIAIAQRDIGSSPFHNDDTEVSVSFRRKIGDDQEFTADARYDRAANSFSRPDRTLQIAPAGSETFTRFDTGAVLATTGAKADYKRTLSGGGEFKSGYELRINDSRFFSLVAGGPLPSALVAAPGLSGAFDYRLQVNAGYATWQHRWSDLTVLGGLRLEDARMTIGAPGIAAETTKSLRPYPSLHLSYPLGEDRKLTANYSRRVSRPAPFQLSPVVSYQNERAIYRGNPRLRSPETDAIEVGYDAKGKHGSLTVTAFHRLVHHELTSIARELDNGVVLVTTENLGGSRRSGLSTSLSRKMSDRLTATLSGDLYRREIRAADTRGTGRSAFGGTARAGLSWQATSADLLQGDLRATSRSITPQGDRTGYFSLNLGYRRRLTPNLFAVVSAQNVLDSLNLSETVRTPTLVYRRSLHALPPTVTFGLTYSFGGAKTPPPSFDFGGGGASAPP